MWNLVAQILYSPLNQIAHWNQWRFWLSQNHLFCPMASAAVMCICIHEIKKAECKEKKITQGRSSIQGAKINETVYSKDEDIECCFSMRLFHFFDCLTIVDLLWVQEIGGRKVSILHSGLKCSIEHVRVLFLTQVWVPSASRESTQK